VAPTGTWALPRTAPVDGAPAWLADLRRSAADWVDAHGLPTRKDEDWRYTRLGPVLAVPFEAAPFEAAPFEAAPFEGVPFDAVPSGPTPPGLVHERARAAVDGLGAGLGGPRLVFVNGLFAPELSHVGALPRGATVTNLASALTDGAEGLGRVVLRRSGPFHHAFVALNTALGVDGAFISLTPGTVVEAPIELVFFSGTGGSPVMSNPRSVVLAGAGSRATVVESYTGVPGDAYCTNAVTEIVMGAGADVAHYKIQDEATSAFHFGLLDVRQHRESRCSSQAFAIGSQVARHEVRAVLEGDGAAVDLNGLYMPGGDQHHDNPVLVEHSAQRGTSRQLYKGVADGHGHGVFNGHIIVRPEAAGTDARQTNKNLLLSDDAEIDTRPRLEILTDDVKCAHGATVGRLDGDALFYMRSRGVPEAQARGILTYAFAQEMLDLVPLQPLRAHVEALVARRLATGTDDQAKWAFR
jgi:Fe-S cluster assembly protein SufD